MIEPQNATPVAPLGQAESPARRPGMFVLGLLSALLTGLAASWAILLVGFLSFTTSVVLALFTSVLIIIFWAKRARNSVRIFSFQLGFLVSISILQFLLFVLLSFHGAPNNSRVSGRSNLSFNSDPTVLDNCHALDIRLTVGPVNFVR